MIEFPAATAVHRRLPKEAFYKHLPLTKILKEKFVSDVDRIVVENSFTKENLNLASDADIKEIMLLSISLKNQEFDGKVIEAIARQNPHKLVFLLSFESQQQLAVYYNKLYRTLWMDHDEIALKLQGYSLDEIWNSFIEQIALYKERAEQTNDLSIEDRLAIQDQILKLEKQINKTENAMWKEQQPKKKFELHTRLREYQKKLENLKMHTPDLADENFKKLAALFPNAVTETIIGYKTNGEPIIERAIDADVLRQEISATVVEGPQERYQFTWPDKKKSVVLANQPIAKTLRLDREKSVGKDGTPGNIDTENIYIEGDNLDALKLLQETYLGKVKMIYIDPPYNTGNDFIYEDDFSQDTDEYLGNSGQFDEEGNRLVQNTESNGRFHTDWLNMIYPRLRLAKDLLADDGVIFISIDDGENGNLRKACNEIFGEHNFLANLIWEKKYTVANDALFFSDNHDHILCYVKNVSSFIIGKLPRTDEMNAAYKNPDNHPKGPWKATPLHAKSGSANSATFSYTFKNGVVFTPPAGTFSRYSAETLRKFDENDEIWFGKDGTSIPSRKTFLCDLKNKGIVPRTIIPFTTGGHNHEAVEEVKNLLQDNVFTNPKPVKLLKYLLTVGNCKENSIILDFFSGSATTAHAIMQLNAEDSGHRKFIMVQLPEQTDAKSEAYKAGYKTICEIGEERIRRAGKKIKEESPLTTTDLDIGFRVFKVDSTNMEDVYYRPADYNQGQMELFADNIKPDRTPEDLLFQIMLDLGILLSSDIQETEIAGKKVFSVADGYLIACFDKDVTEETVKAIAQKQPVYAVFRDSSMASDSVATNFEQIFETYSPRTQRKVL